MRRHLVSNLIVFRLTMVRFAQGLAAIRGQRRAAGIAEGLNVVKVSYPSRTFVWRLTTGRNSTSANSVDLGLPVTR